ncbi:MAG: flap structure-specific endonuclease, partial [Nanoarchaeota archaeon]|nr:flap structure-specific endonuclease [Nanoarchaeota archaeon]
VKKGDAYASISQDYDNLIFSCPLLIRNLSIAGKRKRAGKFAFTTVKPESITLQEVLEHLDLEIDQLIVLAILVGTDYNPGGVKGIGPKTALKLLKEHGKNYDLLFKEAKWDDELDWQVIFNTIKELPTTDDYTLEWKNIDEEKLTQLLVKEYEFSEERVKSKLDKLKHVKEGLKQKGLGSFF